MGYQPSNEGKKCFNFLRSTSKVEELLSMAAENVDKNFNIFIVSNKGKMRPRGYPGRDSKEHFQKISNSNRIRNRRYTRTGSLLLSTQDVKCAQDKSSLLEFMGVSVQTRILFDNITTRFLLFQIPTSTQLEELAHEFKTSNSLYML